MGEGELMEGEGDEGGWRGGGGCVVVVVVVVVGFWK